MKPKVIVIVGPTASGKTSLSIELAKKINGEIVSCDSMQIYKDMDIGSAKPTKEEMQGIKHYIIDEVSPTERFSVARYKQEAEGAIEEILQKGKTPIVVGGTGLYANSLIYGIEYDDIKLDEKYREELMKIAETQEGLEKLYEEAKKIDKKAMEKISQNDKKRIIRILEIYKATGKNKTEQEIQSRKNEVKYDYKVFGINIERPILYERINKRVDIMLEQGLIDEVKKLIKKYPEFPTAMQAIGYKEIVLPFSIISPALISLLINALVLFNKTCESTSRGVISLFKIIVSSSSALSSLQPIQSNKARLLKIIRSL